MAKEKVVTTTGIEADEVEAHKITLDLLKSKFSAGDAPAVLKRDDLPLGKWVEVIPDAKDAENAFLIYTVEERDLDAEYAKLTPKDQRVYWTDGYKRKEVNAPNHLHIKQELGLIERSSKVQKAVDGIKLDIALGLITTGMPFDDIVRLTQLPPEFITLAVKQVELAKQAEVQEEKEKEKEKGKAKK